MCVCVRGGGGGGGGGRKRISCLFSLLNGRAGQFYKAVYCKVTR